MTEQKAINPTTDEIDDHAFWLSMLENVTAPTPFMIDTPAYGIGGGEDSLQRRSLQIPGSAETLRNFTDAHGIDQETLVVGLWAILLTRYSGNEHVLFALHDSDPESEPGAWLPVSAVISHSDVVVDWLHQLKSGVSETSGKKNPGMSALQSLSGVDDNTPLLESIVTFRSIGVEGLQMPLQLRADATDDLHLEIEFQTPRFNDASIGRLLGHLETLFAACTANPDARICELPMLRDKERHQILDIWNDSAIEYPHDKCLHEVFEEQVVRAPDAVAIIHESRQLTYKEVNERSNQLASYLCQRGACAGQLVAISLGRGFDMAIAMMAVAKSGAAYVPLDPSYPADRLSFMLEDTEALILITESDLIKNFAAFKGTIVAVDDERQAIEKCDTENINASVTPQDLAYVIFTSGSTGTPKGAVLNHQGRVNNFADFNRRYDIGPGDTLLALASISFDMSVYDVFGTLMCGASLVMADASNIQGAASWARLMDKHRVTVWHSVPALMEMLVDRAETHPEHNIEALRLVLLGGDWIPVALPDRLKKLVPAIHVVSMGGATEVSMDSTIYDINNRSSDWKSIPYGFPMANQLTYVLDAALQPLPIGVPGELHLGGVGVGEGYWKREDLTAEKFIPNPFRDGERIYKTGDLARFGEDGCLELLGRIDFQVKIRGFRVELGEIESRLRKHASVRECVVLAKDDQNNNKRLVAYILPEETEKTVSDAYDEQVEKWAAVYDRAYSADDDQSLEDETFKITSWDSSYTDQPYSEAVMRTWVDSTVKRIRELGAKRVLEIGCGTGLLLFRLAPDCEVYHGTDISDVALDHVATHTKRLGLSQVTLEKRGGDNFAGLEPGGFDLVILNSIVMDFPDVDYLNSVLAGAAKLVSPGGNIFVGDVRELRSLKTFQTSVQLGKARSALDCDSLKQLVNQRVDREEELLLDPRYFVALQNDIPEINGVNIQLKRGRPDNEMTKFRYDVTLSIENDESPVSGNVSWLEWRDDVGSIDELTKILEKEKKDYVAIRNVPNERLDEDIAATRLLDSENKYDTVRNLRRAVKEQAGLSNSVDPESIWKLAESAGRHAEIRCAAESWFDYFDVVIAPVGESACRSVQSGWTLDSELEPEHYSNNPLQAMQRREHVAKLRSYLAGVLPDYMVPSAFLIMDKFPLNPNGKLNRRAFPEPDNLRPDLMERYVPASTSLEKVVSEMWCDVLNIDRAGLLDRFIELGGNSLLATQVVSRVKEIFGIDLPLTYSINSSLVELAEQIDATATAVGLDANESAAMYLELLTMSDEELQQLNF